MFRVLLLLVLSAGFGCATVPAWDRGILADCTMDPNDGAAGAASAFEDHTFDVREGSTPCGGGSGGGCGCN